MPASVKLNEARDLLYVRLGEGKVAETREYGDHRLIDFDANGKVLGAEFITLGDEIDLRGLPDHRRFRDAVLVGALSDFVIRADHREHDASAAVAQGEIMFRHSNTPTVVWVRPLEDQYARTSGPATSIAFWQESS